MMGKFNLRPFSRPGGEDTDFQNRGLLRRTAR